MPARKKSTGGRRVSKKTKKSMTMSDTTSGNSPSTAKTVDEKKDQDNGMKNDGQGMSDHGGGVGLVEAPPVQPGGEGGGAETSPVQPEASSATRAPTTRALATRALATLTPATRALATLAPATRALATLAPATRAKATRSPATEAPGTQAPSKRALATRSQSTRALATRVPATRAPASRAPSTQAPSTQAPATRATGRADGGRRRSLHSDQLNTNTDVPGYVQGLTPVRIFGATDVSGEVMFMTEWFGSDEWDWVPARIANIAYPQAVIRFYEENLVFHDNY